jgi:hypothetical protein
MGYQVLLNSIPTGPYNTGAGNQALLSNTDGGANSAFGWETLRSNTHGINNTGLGFEALSGNTTGGNNTASGYAALGSNTLGSNNTAVGSDTLSANTIGGTNTVVGSGALQDLKSGNNNIAMGYLAGHNVTSGSNNIEIGTEGASGDNKVIKIGTEGTQSKTYIAGIYGTSVAGSPVYIAANGELGTVVSSERFKTDIAPMGSNTARLERLRPVTFQLKTDSTGTLQYGLIAEEVAKIYPELVIRDETGRIDGVRYDELAPMLLNEMQKEHATVAAQAAQINQLEQQLAEIRTALVTAPNKNRLVAQR